MFRIGMNVTKSRQVDENTLEIEGIASSPIIDVDNERFTEDAVKNMLDSVNAGGIPVRVEHENKFYSDIGTWKEAKLIDGNKLWVKGTIDLELSLAKDLSVLLKRGKQIAMSVGGRVKEASMEWLQDANKWVQTYKDMSLIEISIVKNPANPEATLSIAKSFDAKAGTETPEAVSISKSAEDLLKIDAVQTQVIEGETLKNFYDDIGSAYSGEMELTLSEAKESADLDDFDLKFLSTFIQAALDFKGRDKVEMPESLNKALYGGYEKDRYINPPEFQDECYVIELLPGRYFLHHNLDFTLNEEWLKYWLYQLVTVSGDAKWLTPKQFRYALIHLYSHYKMLAVTKAKSNPIIKSQDMHIQKENTLDETTMNLLKSCYDFKVLKAGERPQVEGNDLSDKEVAKCATAYKILVERNRAAASVGTQMKEAFILKHTTDMQKQEVTKSEEAVIAETAVATEAVATEATAKAVTTEETTTAEKSAEEVTTEATATEEATTEVTKTEEVTEETTEVKTDVATEVSGDTLATKSTDETKDEAVTTVSEEVGDEASINKTVTEDAEASPTSEVTETAEVASEATTEKTEAISEEVILEKAKAMFDEAITAAVEKAVSGVTAQFSETISKMQAELDSAKETVTKSHKDEADKFSAIEKSVGELTGIATQQANLIQKMNTAFAGRRSLATTVVEKSFGSDSAESLTQDTIAAEIHKAMDADSKMTFGEARASVYKRLEQSA